MRLGHEILWVLGGLLLYSALPLVFGSYGLYLGSSLCVWIIFALAYDLAFGRTGLLSFGHAMFFGLGAYGLVILVQQFGWTFWPALAGAVVVTAVFTALIGTVALRVTGHAFVVITVIFGAIVELFAYSRKEWTNGEDGIGFEVPPVGIGPASLDLGDPTTKYYFLFVFLAGTYLLLSWINHSSLGLAFRAIRENPRRAMLLGYPVQRYKLIAFSLSGAVSGLAGALFGLLTFHVSAEAFHITISINPLTSVLVGGAGTMLGPILGTTFIFLLSDYLRSLVVYSEFAIGVILVLTVLFAPTGLVGIARRIRARWRSRHGGPARESREAGPAGSRGVAALREKP